MIVISDSGTVQNESFLGHRDTRRGDLGTGLFREKPSEAGLTLMKELMPKARGFSSGEISINVSELPERL